MNPRFVIEALSNSHHRGDFSSGSAKVDNYFRDVVSQDVKRNYASGFVAVEPETGKIAGFYTLSSSNIPLADIPRELARKLPRYPTVPAVLIGWLGRDLAFRGSNLGALLLFDAIKTVASAPIGAHAVFADAIGEEAAAFYEGFQFTRLTRRPLTLHLPMSTALRLAGPEGQM